MTKKQLFTFISVSVIILLSIIYLTLHRQLGNKTIQNQTDTDNYMSTGQLCDLNNISKETDVNVLKHYFLLLQDQVNLMINMVTLLETEVVKFESNILRADELGIDCSKEKVTLLESKRDIIKSRILIKNNNILLEKIIERLDELQQIL